MNASFGRNPSLCSPGSSCNNKNGNKVVVPLVASLGGAFMILVITVISFCIYKRKRSVGTVVARSIDGEGEQKKVMHLRLANESGSQGSDAQGLR